MTELTVNLSELRKILYLFNQLEKGTGYELYSTSEIINHSRGELFKQTNAMYRELMQIEETLIEIITNTKLALTNAGVNFEEADNYLSERFGSVGALTNTHFTDYNNVMPHEKG